MLSVVCWMSFIYLFWKIGDPFPILSPKYGSSCCQWNKLFCHLDFLIQEFSASNKCSVGSEWSAWQWWLAFRDLALSTALTLTCRTLWSNAWNSIFKTLNPFSESSRPVTQADIHVLTKHLMKTMDMICVKKKRLLIVEKERSKNILASQKSAMWKLWQAVASPAPQNESKAH